MTDGFREGSQSWRALLLDRKRHGLNQDLKLAIGAGALGFRTSLREPDRVSRRAESSEGRP